MAINGVIGVIIMLLGILMITIGIIGIYKYKDFYVRVAIAALIDTAGFICVTIGLIIYMGLSILSLKLCIIIFLMMLLNPLSSHMIARGANANGHYIKKGD